MSDRSGDRDFTPPAAPQLTAVIPAYNRERTLGRAIESALAQSHAPAEVVVVDDGSTDRTREVAQGFGAPVRCVLGAHRGASAARNLGVREARSDWIAFLDSDDYWLAGHLERMAAAIRATGGRADLYFDDLRLSPDQGGDLVWRSAGFAIAGPFELAQDGTDWALLPIQPHMLQASVIRREAYLALGGLCEALRTREDTHLFLALSIGRPVCAVAGCGGEMSADESAQSRLTHRYGAASRRYWESTAWLYADILARYPGLAAHHRADLRRRKAVAHFWLARRAGQPLAALRHLAAGIRSDPAELLRKLARRGAD